jgi:signal transduction histidine kinase
VIRSSSLKVKLGLYATLICLLALAAGVVPLLSAVYFHQLIQLDRTLTRDAEELATSLKNFRGAPIDPRRPLSEKFIPFSFAGRHLVIEGPEGQVLYQSPGLRGKDFTGIADGATNRFVVGEKYRFVSRRVPPYRIHIGNELGFIERFERDLVSDLLFTVPFVAVVVFIGGLWLGRRAVAPVAAITATAERITASNLNERLPIPSSEDEIADLSEVINRTLDRLQASYNSASRFSADASHQLKTPLTILRAGLDHLSTSPAILGEDREEVDTLRQQVRRLTTLIEDLLLLAQADTGNLAKERESHSLRTILEGLLDDLDVLVLDKDITVETAIPEHIHVSVNLRQIQIALQSLTENAAKYTPHGGRIRFTASVEGRETVLRISNSGPLIPGEERETIFERFRRGNVLGENIGGYGLGLNIARELIRAHSGDLKATTSSDQLNEFVVTLPAADIPTG